MLAVLWTPSFGAYAQSLGRHIMHGTWYGLRDGSSSRTADGTRFSAHDPSICAAPYWLPFGARLRITNRINKRVLHCTVHDRGRLGRSTIDVTYGGSRILRMPGTAP